MGFGYQFGHSGEGKKGILGHETEIHTRGGLHIFCFFSSGHGAALWGLMLLLESVTVDKMLGGWRCKSSFFRGNMGKQDDYR